MDGLAQVHSLGWKVIVDDSSYNMEFIASELCISRIALWSVIHQRFNVGARVIRLARSLVMSLNVAEYRDNEYILHSSLCIIGSAR